MAEQITMYISKEDFTDHVEQQFLSKENTFSKWLKTQNIIVMDFVPPSIQETIKRTYPILPSIEILHTDGSVQRQSGEDVYTWLEAQDPTWYFKDEE